MSRKVRLHQNLVSGASSNVRSEMKHGDGEIMTIETTELDDMIEPLGFKKNETTGYKSPEGSLQNDLEYFEAAIATDTPAEAIPGLGTEPSTRPSILRKSSLAAKIYDHKTALNAISSMKTVSEKFAILNEETTGSPHFINLADREEKAGSYWAYCMYRLENMISADANIPFYLLCLVSLAVIFILAGTWAGITRTIAKREKSTAGPGRDAADSPEEGELDFSENLWGAFFMTFQIVMTGGFDGSILDASQRVLFTVMLVSGVTLVSVLIGLITDSISTSMEALTSGSSSVLEKNHTLVLGWNESTARFLVQIAFLRRSWIIQNERWDRVLFPWLRVRAPSPVATSKVIVLWDGMSKQDMEEATRFSFLSRGIKACRTMVGRDVLFRTGDPCSATDLIRVAAHHATAICVMMTQRDQAEVLASMDPTTSQTYVANSATLRCLLALRNVIYSNGDIAKTFNPLLRVVVQLNSECQFTDAVSFLAPDGRPCVYAQDLRRYINSMLFHCASKPGLSRVWMALLNFEGACIRSGSVKDIRGGPRNEKGYFVGLSIRDAELGHCWHDGSILIGCDDSRFNFWDEEYDKNGYDKKGSPGIMSDPDRLIRSDDQLIFVSKTPNPQARQPVRTRADFEAEAENVRRSRGGLESWVDDYKPPQRIMLCGWRYEWNHNPERFMHRVSEIARYLPKKSTLTCVNLATREAFARFITDEEECGFVGDHERGFRKALPLPEGFEFFANITLFHFSADTIDFEMMEDLVKDNEFDTAVVLGSVVGKELTPEARDSRVLSCLIILRKLFAMYQSDTAVHIIAENQMDQTSTLALVPSTVKGRKVRGYEPDFINTQAIVARSLCVNIAYPEVYDAISDLTNISDLDLEMFPPQAFGLLDQSVSFGCVQHLVNSDYRGYAIVIGYMTRSKLYLGIPFDQITTLTSNHRIVCIVRERSIIRRLKEASKKASIFARVAKRKGKKAMDIIF